jgi:hypothetical protein
LGDVDVEFAGEFGFAAGAEEDRGEALSEDSKVAHGGARRASGGFD